MFKKIIATCICYSLFTVTAFAATPKENFRDSVRDLSYELSVVWDQKDSAFFDKAMEGFKKNVSKLTKSGLSIDDATDVILNEAKNEQAKSELKELFDSVKAQKLSETEVADLLSEYSESLQSRGANYIGHRGPDPMMAFLGIMLLAGSGYYAYSYIAVPSVTCVDGYYEYDYWGNLYWVEGYCY